MRLKTTARCGRSSRICTNRPRCRASAPSRTVPGADGETRLRSRCRPALALRRKTWWTEVWQSWLNLINAWPAPRSRSAMKWPHHRNLRNRPPTPSKGRGPVQVRIRRAFIASGAEVLSSTQIYDWTHSRRRQSRRKKLPFGVYWRTLKTLRAMCEPVERVPPHGAWLWRLRNTADN